VFPADLIDRPIVFEHSRGVATGVGVDVDLHKLGQFFAQCSPIERAWYHAMQLTDAMAVLVPGKVWFAKVGRRGHAVGAFSQELPARKV